MTPEQAARLIKLIELLIRVSAGNDKMSAEAVDKEIRAIIHPGPSLKGPRFRSESVNNLALAHRAVRAGLYN